MIPIDPTRSMLGTLLATIAASSVLAAGCGGGSGPDRPPTATEAVYQSREKAILERYEKTKQQNPTMRKRR